MTDYEAAMRLLRMIARSEGKTIDANGPPGKRPDRAWIIKTFSECLLTVRHPTSAL